MTEILTERLVLRRAREEDLAAVHAFLSDEEAMRYWAFPPHAALAQTEEWLRSMIDAPAELSEDFIITRDGEPIGKIGAWRLPEFGFILRSDVWGQGYAQEAMTAFLDHAFGMRGVDDLIADVDPRNAASLKLLDKFGFVEAGRATATWTTHMGVCDSVYLRLRRQDRVSAD